MLYSNDIIESVFGLRNVFDDFFREVPLRTRSMEFPYINLYENGDSVEINAIVPGVSAEDLDLHFTDDSLIIEGVRKSDLKDKPYIRKEREFGRFKKAVRMPFPVNRDKINASLKDGILNVTLEKSEDAKPRKIEIK